MAYNMLSPEVKTIEVDYSDYVSSMSSSIVGMVGCARRGPLVPTLVTSQEQFIKLFGTPSTKEYGAYSALQALTQVSSLYYQRVVHNAPHPTAGISGVDKYIFTARESGSKYNNYKVVITAGTSGKWNISITDSTHKVEESYENLIDSTSDATSVLSTINSRSNIVSVAMMDKGTISAKELVLAGGVDGASYGTAGKDTLPFTIRTKYYDSTLNYCIVKFTKPDLAGYFDMMILSKDRSTIIEQLPNLTLDETDERFVDTLVANSSEYIQVKYNKDYDKSETTEFSSVEYVITGGDDGIDNVDTNDIIGTTNDGLKAFSNPEVLDINILCAPGWYQADVTNAGTKICEDRGDAVYIFDTPFGLSAQRANDWVNGANEFASDHSAFDSSYSVAYWPWVQISDSFTHKDIWLPPTGFIAAVYAYSDNVSQLWYAPAGLNRGMLSNAKAVEYSATKGERDIIYGNRNCVNPIINYKNVGLVVWGQKTTQRRSTALDRVNVRRLLNYLKKIISSSTNYFLFDPNDEYQWNRWIDMVDPKLKNVKELRGVVDYKVEMNPTVDEIENNTMPGTIWIKPTKAAEYIPISFMISPQSAVFNEEINS